MDETGEVTPIASSFYHANKGSVIFTTDHFSVYGVGYTVPSAKFTDTLNHWAREPIDSVVSKGFFSGASETAFAPDTAMTRGMLVTTLGRLAGVNTNDCTANSFTDVTADQCLTGTQTIDGVQYFFETNGKLKIDWVKDGDNWSFYSGNIMCTGWQDIDGKWYYFYANGSLAVDTKIDEYEVDENGMRKTK